MKGSVDKPDFERLFNASPNLYLVLDPARPDAQFACFLREEQARYAATNVMFMVH